MAPGDLIKNMTEFTDYVEFPNLVTGGWYWTTILLVLFFILYFTLLKRNTPKASAFASLFVCSLVGLIFSFVGLIPFFIFTQMLILLAFGSVIFFDKLS